MVTQLDAPHTWSRSERWWEKKFLAGLTSSENACFESVEAIVAEASEHFAHDHSSVTDRASQSHLLLAVYVLAAYQHATREGMTDADALSLITDCLVSPGAAMARLGVAWSLRFSRDRLATLRAQTRRQSERVYGNWFVFEEEDSDRTFVSVVTQCGFVDYFTRHGVPQLTAAFCAWDAAWSSGIEAAKHGVQFQRPTTIAGGDPACRFEFSRVDARGDDC